MSRLMGRQFFRVFDSERYGRILALRKQGEDGPELQVLFRPPALDVCTVGFQFTDDAAGAEQADRALESLTCEQVEAMIADVTQDEIFQQMEAHADDDHTA